MDDRVRVRAVARGNVQGVGYRYFAMRLARDLGIAGWIRNREDSAVELEAEGERTVVGSFLRDLKTGPRGADVAALDIEEMPLDPAGGRFEIRS